MSNDEHVRRKQIEGMSTEQIAARIEQDQHEIDAFLEHLLLRASMQEYSEQQYNELIVLLQEALMFIEELSSLPLEWVERQRELIAKLKRKI